MDRALGPAGHRGGFEMLDVSRVHASRVGVKGSWVCGTSEQLTLCPPRLPAGGAGPLPSWSSAQRGDGPFGSVVRRGLEGGWFSKP